MSTESSEDPEGSRDRLICPRCGRGHRPSDRLCESCSMPLVIAERAEEPATGAAHEQARKINPRYARGELTRVAVGHHQAEAELIKGMLLEHGIPSLLRRTGGFDVPDFLAAGPRDVLVPSSGAEEARALLSEVQESTVVDGIELEPTGPGAAALDYPETDLDLETGPGGRSWQLKLIAGSLALLLAFGAVVGVIWALI